MYASANLHWLYALFTIVPASGVLCVRKWSGASSSSPVVKRFRNRIFWTSVEATGGNIIRAGRREASIRSSGIRYAIRVSQAKTAELSLEPSVRRCYDPSCGRLFTICVLCYRGQRYCGDGCRKRMRRQQVLAAGRRYQASDVGKQAHCRRQRDYRKHQRSSSV